MLSLLVWAEQAAGREATEIRGAMEFLADDALQGRGSGTHDEMVAAVYLASQLRQIGIEPAGDNATTVRVSLKYDPPGGKLGSLVARLFGENPQQQIEDDLGRFKEIMEGNLGASAGASAGK